MKKYTKCQNCAKEGLTVPLSRDNHGLVCALCGTTFHEIKPQE